MTTNILSIDWDYYIDISSSDRTFYFPDGGEYATKLMNLIWVQRYIFENKDKVEKFYVQKEKINILTNWLKQIKPKLKNTELHLALGHQDIAGLVLDRVDLKDDLNITNIDFHHDSYGGEDIIEEEQVHCGNWINFLQNRGYNLEVDWIHREDSDLEIEKLNKNVKPTLDYEKFKTKIPDYIFLCKSPGYSPPHLDIEFINFMYKIFENVKGTYMFTEEVMENRYPKVRKMAKEKAKEKEKDLKEMGLAD